MCVVGSNSHLLPRLINTSIFGRGLPFQEYLRDFPDTVDAFKAVLLSGSVRGIWRRDDKGRSLVAELGVRTCYVHGWLHSELEDPDSEEPDTVFIFPSVLHQRCMEWKVTRSTPRFPLERYPSVEALAMEVVKNFNIGALNAPRQPLSAGAEYRPLEAMYQDEFYRSSYSLLGDIHLLSEWAGPSKNGRIDFLVRSVAWGIECVRDSSKLGEHISGFLPGGRYYRWIESGAMKQYILLNFCHELPSQAAEHPWIFHIVYFLDHSTYSVYNGELRQIMGPLSLGNH